MDIIVTVPKTINWEDYQKELDAVKDYSQVMNFKVSTKPNVKPGDKCYICHDGYIKGWMKIVGISNNNFDCTTTGKNWRGLFVQRSGPFHYELKKIPMKGFQGFRYYKT